MHCEAQPELVIKQNNAQSDSFPRIYLCPFSIWRRNWIWKKSLWTRFLLQVMSYKTRGSWSQKVNVGRFVEAKYIVVCSNIRCQIYFCKKLFICSFSRICFLFQPFCNIYIYRIIFWNICKIYISFCIIHIYLPLQPHLLLFLNLFTSTID